ncbi:MAG TPA: tetraacyldisaccharide 4'-kinase [Candidatus Binataceae bacterium]|nr:tetraacyldisaccharide 4'-kinase [Candidatus Binataceae bacterium]
MKAQSFTERLWRPALPTCWWPLWAALAPASALYSGALAMRERWWQSRAADAGVPIISVGNLTVGGNGKTPFALFLASRMLARGLAVAIISRGWGGTSETAALVSDGKSILMAPRTAGDEPVMMAKSFAGPIAVARRRIEAVRLLSTRGHFDAFILDDGFQHLPLRRDLDLILINAVRGFGNGWVLPAGPLREPRSAISRADAIVLIDSGGRRAPLLTAADLALPEHLPIIHASIRPRALVRADDLGWHECPPTLAGQRVIAVSGLADAAGFHAMLANLGATLVATFDFPDHHDYTPHDVENILSAARNADNIVTTEKDLVKLERFPLADVSLYALRLEVSMDAGDEARLFDLIATGMRTRRGSTLPGAGSRTPN